MQKSELTKKNISFCGARATYIFKQKALKIILLYKNYFWGFSTEITDTSFLHVDKASSACANFFFKKKSFKLSKPRAVIFSSIFFFFKKFKFKGKGYKIKKNKNKHALKFYFGHSHKKILILPSVSFKKIKKIKFLAISTNIKKLTELKNALISIKPLDLYTKRGLRASRQITKKRPGKKKTY